jgi:hypothetical protein
VVTGMRTPNSVRRTLGFRRRGARRVALSEEQLACAVPAGSPAAPSSPSPSPGPCVADPAAVGGRRSLVPGPNGAVHDAALLRSHDAERTYCAGPAARDARSRRRGRRTRVTLPSAGGSGSTSPRSGATKRGAEAGVRAGGAGSWSRAVHKTRPVSCSRDQAGVWSSPRAATGVRRLVGGTVVRLPGRSPGAAAVPGSQKSSPASGIPEAGPCGAPGRPCTCISPQEAGHLSLDHQREADRRKFGRLAQDQ